MTNASDGDLLSLLSVFDPSRSRHFAAAFAISSVLIVITGIAFAYNTVPLPVVVPFIPIVATFWIVFESLTAFLLLSQFLVTGYVPFAVFGGTFALTSMLTAPYLVFFPNVFARLSLLGMDQMAAWLWLAWHFTFAAVAIAYVARDRDLTLRCDAAAVASVFRWTLALAVVVAVAIVVPAALWQPHVPTLVTGGHFTRDFSYPHARSRS